MSNDFSSPNPYGTPPTGYNSPQPPSAGDFPGKTMGLVAMILSIAGIVFPTSLIGLILGYVAKKQSTDAGFENPNAKIAIIVGWILVALSVLLFVIFIAIAGLGASVNSSSMP